MGKIMNIVFIVGDGLRTSNIGYYDNQKNTTPTIDNLADTGVLFEDAYSCTNHTDPSFTTMLSGLHPISHGIVHHGSTSHGVTEEEIRIFNETNTKLLPEILKTHGYYNVAFDWLGRWHKRGYDFYGETDGFSFSLGLEKILEYFPEKIYRYLKRKLHRHNFVLPARSGKYYTDLAIKFIKNKLEDNFFLLLHNWDTHTPFSTLPSSYTHKFHTKSNGKKVKDMLKEIENEKWREIVKNYHLQGMEYMSEIPALYDGAANFFDHLIKKLLECLEEEGFLDKTIVIVTSDHGDNGVRDGKFVGHFGLYDPVIHVPLILWGPGIPEGKRINGFVQHTDILPTLLELLGIEFDDSILDGHSLLPLIHKQEKSPRSWVLAQDAAARMRYAIRTSKYKYIYSPTPNESIVDFDTIGCRYPVELYDLEKDPEESKNIVNEKAAIAEELEEKLLSYLENLKEKRDILRRKSEIKRIQEKILNFKKMRKI